MKIEMRSILVTDMVFFMYGLTNDFSCFFWLHGPKNPMLGFSLLMMEWNYFSFGFQKYKLPHSIVTIVCETMI